MKRSAIAVGGLCLAVVSALGCLRHPLATVGVSRQGDGPFAITNVAVFANGGVVPARDVLIQGGRVYVHPAGDLDRRGIPIPLEYRIDGSGQTLLSGLADMHVHLDAGVGGPPWKLVLPDADNVLGALAYAGVTSALVAQWANARPAPIGDPASAAHPHLFRAGMGLTSSGGHPTPLVKALTPWWARGLLPHQPEATTPDEARAEVRRAAAKDRPLFFKLFVEAIPADLLPPHGAPALSNDALSAAVAEARRLGMRPIAHVGSASEFMSAIHAKVDLVMHAPHADKLTWEQVKEIKASGIPFVTTLDVFDSLERLEKPEKAGPTDLEREVAGAKLLRSFRDRPEDWRHDKKSAGVNLGVYERHFSSYRENRKFNVDALIKEGVPFFPGTDTLLAGVLPGAALHHEIASLVSLGVNPGRVLQAATRDAAVFLEPGVRAGEIVDGARADLVLVNGDPTLDIAALGQIKEVFVNGLRLDRQCAR